MQRADPTESEEDEGRQTAGFPLALAVFGFVAMALLILAPANLPRLQALDRGVEDVLGALYSDRRSNEHPRLAIVRLGGEDSTAWDRGQIAAVVAAIDRLRPAAIGLDVELPKPTDPEKDRALNAALRDAQAPVVVGVRDDSEGPSTAERAYQIALLAASGRPSGFTTVQLDSDGVVRRHMLPGGGRSLASLPLQLARNVYPAAREPAGRIAWLQLVNDSDPLSWLVNWWSLPPFTEVQGSEVLREGSDLRVKLTGRLVLIGAGNARRYPTTLTAWTGRDAAAADIHAQELAQILDQRSVEELPSDVIRYVLVALACAGGLIGWSLRQGHRAWLGCLGVLLVLLVLAIEAASALSLMLPLASMMLATLAGMLAGHYMGVVNDIVVEHAARRSKP